MRRRSVGDPLDTTAVPVLKGGSSIHIEQVDMHIQYCQITS